MFIILGPAITWCGTVLISSLAEVDYISQKLIIWTMTTESWFTRWRCALSLIRSSRIYGFSGFGPTDQTEFSSEILPRMTLRAIPSCFVLLLRQNVTLIHSSGKISEPIFKLTYRYCISRRPSPGGRSGVGQRARTGLTWTEATSTGFSGVVFNALLSESQNVD